MRGSLILCAAMSFVPGASWALEPVLHHYFGLHWNFEKSMKPSSISRMDLDLDGDEIPELLLRTDWTSFNDPQWAAYRLEGNEACFLGYAFAGDGNFFRKEGARTVFRKIVPERGEFRSDVALTVWIEDEEIRVLEAPKQHSEYFESLDGFSQLAVARAPVAELFQALRSGTRETWSAGVGRAAPVRSLVLGFGDRSSQPLLRCSVVSSLRTRDESIFEHLRRTEFDPFDVPLPDRIVRFDLDLDGDGRLEAFLKTPKDSGRGPTFGSWRVYAQVDGHPCWAGGVSLAPEDFWLEESPRRIVGLTATGEERSTRSWKLIQGRVVEIEGERETWNARANQDKEASAKAKLASFRSGAAMPAVITGATSSLLGKGDSGPEVWLSLQGQPVWVQLFAGPTSSAARSNGFSTVRDCSELVSVPPAHASPASSPRSHPR